MTLKRPFSSLGLAAAVLSSLVACTDDSTRESASYSTTTSAVIELGGPAELETVAATRGTSALDTTAQRSALTGPGVVTTTRAAFIEVVEQQADGFEQSWSFERSPGSDGDLVIAVGMNGLEYVGTTSDGLSFRASSFSVNYGNGTWIDAGGVRSAVPATYSGGRILLTIPASLVNQSPYPAVLDPQIIVTPLPL